MQVEKHENGRFCWAELSTSDGPGAKSFYTSLFGWEAIDNPMGPNMVYTMLQVKGRNVGALYQDSEGKVPPHWSTYISVDDADATAAKARSLGATVIDEPFDVMTFGRMAVFQDVTGAFFSIWQAKDHIGYSLINEVGSVCWNELNTRDAAKAAEFYCGLFGYTAKSSEMPMPYTELQLDGKSIAGIFTLGPDLAHVPPHWTIYWTVTNCEETFAKAKSLGAQPIVPPKEIPGVGTMAIMTDPQGAVFAFVD